MHRYLCTTHNMNDVIIYTSLVNSYMQTNGCTSINTTNGADTSNYNEVLIEYYACTYAHVTHTFEVNIIRKYIHRCCRKPSNIEVDPISDGHLGQFFSATSSLP